MLEIYELLDRFELLYPTNSKLSDLRRSYIDRDLSSIFRLLPNTVNGDIEDLRKAVTEHNNKKNRSKSESESESDN